MFVFSVKVCWGEFFLQQTVDQLHTALLRIYSLQKNAKATVNYKQLYTIIFVHNDTN